MTQTPLTAAALIVFGLIHVLLAGLQAALAAGAPLGRFAWGGAHRVLPTRLRIGSVATIGVYGLFVFLALEAAKATDVLPGLVAAVGIWVLAAYFLLGIVMNAMSRSKAERLTMAPACVILAASSVLLALP